MDKISIIIVSYNTQAITDRCLAAVEDSRLENPFEIIVVDNASTDGSVEMIKTKHPKVKLIASKTNTGFTGGNNLAMKQATGNYFLLLNSDAFLQENTLSQCLEAIKNADVIGCKLTFEDGSLQPSAGYLPNPLNTFLWVWGLDVFPILRNIIPSVHPQIKSFFESTHSVGWVTGAFMFMKREVYDKTSGFDEKYFMYTEEVDWCKRMHNEKFTVKYVANFSIVHLMGASTGKNVSYIKEMQGLVYYFKKHYPAVAPLMKIIIKTGNMARIIAFEVTGNKTRANIYREIVQSL